METIQDKINECYIILQENIHAKEQLNKLTKVIISIFGKNPTIKNKDKKPESILHIQFAIAYAKNNIKVSDKYIGSEFNKSRTLVIKLAQTLNFLIENDKTIVFNKMTCNEIYNAISEKMKLNN